MYKFQINMLAFILSLSIFSYFLHPIAFLFYLLILISFIIFLFDFKETDSLDIKVLLLLSMLVIPFLWGILFTGDIYFREIKDFISMIIYVLYIIIALVYLKNSESFTLFKEKFLFYIKQLGVFFAIFGFIKFFLLKKGIILSFLPTNHGVYGLGTSIGADNNIYAIGLFVSLMAYLFESTKQQTPIAVYLKYVVIIFLFSAIVLSASRRGIVLLALLMLVFLYKVVFVNFIKLLVFKLPLKKHSFILIFFTIIIGTGIIKVGIENSDMFSKIEAKFETLSDINEGEEGSFGPRILRWKYSGDIISEYNIRQLLIGDGFRYLELFGQKFGDGESDGYPHNILLSTMHYGGFFGLSLLVMFFVIEYFLIVQSYTKRIIFSFRDFFYILITIITVYLFYGLSSANTIFEIRPLVLATFIFFIFYFRVLKIEPNKKVMRPEGINLKILPKVKKTKYEK